MGSRRVRHDLLTFTFTFMKDSIKEELREERLGVRKTEGIVQFQGLFLKEKASQGRLPLRGLGVGAGVRKAGETPS